MRDYNHLSEDEIIRDWSLDHNDRLFVEKFIKQYRLWVYLQVCALRLFGQLLDNPNMLDSRIVGYASKSLGLDVVGTVYIPLRDATRTEHKKLIFEHLSFLRFDDGKAHFQVWIEQKVNAGIIIPEQLIADAETFLITSKIAVPTLYYMKREINSICAKKQDSIFNAIYLQLTQTLIESIDLIVEVIPGENVSWHQKFKDYPGASSISMLQEYLIRYKRLVDIDMSVIDLSAIPDEFSKQLYQLGRYYDAYKIKRFKPAKRYTMMIAFLYEAKKVLIDHLIQLHDQYISNICRECKNEHLKSLKLYKNKNEKAIHKIEKFVDYILAQEDVQKISVGDIYSKSTSKLSLQQARDDMHEYKILSQHGYAKLIQNRYNSMRRYFVDFIQLPFMVETGSSELRKAIQLICQLDSKEIQSIPDDIETKFIDNQIANLIRNENGSIKRNLWEMGIAIAIKDGFRSGDLYVAHSNKYASFWELIYQDQEWDFHRLNSYDRMGIEQNAKHAVDEIAIHFHESVSNSLKKFGEDGFADIKNNKLLLKKKEKIDAPIGIKRLQSLISSYLPKIKIEHLLIEVDRMTGFTKHFTPIHNQKSHPKYFYKTLIASILAQATNIGLATMQDCAPGITAEMMRHVTDSCIREETIKASNAELVNQHTQLELSHVHGDGSLSSSDGQRFIITASSLLSSYYPRYAGYYDKMIGVYTHTSNQLSVYSTNAISCAPRESLYVIDGILDNNTVLAIKEHTTDTGGFTEHIFALCYLLGIRFMPRIKDLKNQQLYRIDKNISYGKFDVLFTKTVSIELIAEQFDQMIRIAASLKNKLCPAHEIIRRLSKGSPSDKLSKAFTHLGRIIKTEYILQYITDGDLRDKVQRQLNKGEHRHQLARCIFFANQGKFQVGDYEEIMNKASCLSLVSNAVLYWNTIKMGGIIEQLRKSGEDISDEMLSHISLLLHKHVIPMGTYFTDGDVEQFATEDV